MALRKTGAELEFAPALFRTKAYAEILTQSVLSTSNCGSTALSLFGFGPVVSNGYGIGTPTSMVVVVTPCLSLCVLSLCAYYRLDA